MKVIIKDNFDRETVSDRLVCENCSEPYASLIANYLNAMHPPNHNNFFMAVPDDYKLYQFEP
jgi:hypothetical protein